MRQFLRLLLVELMGCDEFGERRAIDAPGHVVTSGDRGKRARVVVEANGIGNPVCFGRQIPEAPHAGDRIEEPPMAARAAARG